MTIPAKAAPTNPVDKINTSACPKCDTLVPNEENVSLALKSNPTYSPY